MVLFYAGQVARRADRRLPVLRNGRAAPPSEQVDNVLTAAHLLSAQLYDIWDRTRVASQRTRRRDRLGRRGGHRDSRAQI